jgi:hypothetical protein
VAWFDEPTRVTCAVYALLILYNALNRGVAARTHQNTIQNSTSLCMASAAHWLARHGPRELVSVSLSFLSAMVADNANVGLWLSNLNIKIAPGVRGKSVPRDWDERSALLVGPQSG